VKPGRRAGGADDADPESAAGTGAAGADGGARGGDADPRAEEHPPLTSADAGSRIADGADEAGDEAAWAEVVDEERGTEIDDVAVGGPADPTVRGSRAGRNVPIAIGVGVALGALILACLFIYKPSFAFLAGAAVLYGCWELSRAIAVSGARVSLTPLLVGAVAVLVAAWTHGSSGLVVAVLLTACGIAIWRIPDGADEFARDVAASILVLLYLPALAAFAVLLVHPHDGAARVVAFIATVVCSDTGGFATGVLFGRHPLAPIVSKGKTWEGMAGSALFCVALGVLLFTLTFHHQWWQGALFGLAVAITATVGDLGESMIKRDLGIKDMGTLLPGHGGMMDRLDSLLPCAAVAFLLLGAFVPI
jgi:phosphatidate cytidylyltransferase